MRGSQGMLPWKELDHGFSIPEIRSWRDAEEAAGRPSALEDRYAAHGLCRDCDGHGAVMVSWSEPMNPIDVRAAAEFGRETPGL